MQPDPYQPSPGQPNPFQPSPGQPSPLYPDPSQPGYETAPGYVPSPPPPLYPNLGSASVPPQSYGPPSQEYNIPPQGYSTPPQGYGNPPPWNMAPPPLVPPPSRNSSLPLIIGISSVVVLAIIGILIFTSISQNMANQHAQATETAAANDSSGTQIASAATATQNAIIAASENQATATAIAIANQATATAAASENQATATQAAIDSQATATQQAADNDATATAAAIATNTAPGATYTAATPGANCDMGGASWANGQAGMYQCLSNGLQISFNAGQGSLSEEYYQGVNGTFPTNYSLSVNAIAGNLGVNGCAGVLIRNHDNSRGGFGFFLCPQQGFWRLVSFDSTGTPTILDHNSLGVQYQYSITATASGNFQTYSIDGTQVTSYTSGSFSYDSDVILAVDQLGDASNGSAIFSNFSITTN